MPEPPDGRSGGLRLSGTDDEPSIRGAHVDPPHDEKVRQQAGRVRRWTCLGGDELPAADRVQATNVALAVDHIVAVLRS